MKIFECDVICFWLLPVLNDKHNYLKINPTDVLNFGFMIQSIK